MPSVRLSHHKRDKGTCSGRTPVHYLHARMRVEALLQYPALRALSCKVIGHCVCVVISSWFSKLNN